MFPYDFLMCSNGFMVLYVLARLSYVFLSFSYVCEWLSYRVSAAPANRFECWLVTTSMDRMEANNEDICTSVHTLEYVH